MPLAIFVLHFAARFSSGPFPIENWFSLIKLIVTWLVLDVDVCPWFCRPVVYNLRYDSIVLDRYFNSLGCKETDYDCECHENY